MKHLRQSPCEIKTNFHKCCSPSPWFRAQSLVLAKMYIWEAGRDSEFWTSRCSGMLQVLSRKGGGASKPIMGPGSVLSVCYSFYDQSPACPWPTFWVSLLPLAGWKGPSLSLSSVMRPFCLLHCFWNNIRLLPLTSFCCDICFIFSCNPHNYTWLWGARWNSSICTQYIRIKSGQSTWLSTYHWHIRARERFSSRTYNGLPSVSASAWPHYPELIPSTQLCFGTCFPTSFSIMPCLPRPSFSNFKALSHSLILSDQLLQRPQRGRTCDISLSAPSQLTLLPMTGFYTLLWLEMHMTFLYPFV